MQSWQILVNEVSLHLLALLRPLLPQHHHLLRTRLRLFPIGCANQTIVFLSLPASTESAFLKYPRLILNQILIVRQLLLLMIFSRNVYGLRNVTVGLIAPGVR